MITSTLWLQITAVIALNYTVSQKNDTDVAHYNFNTQPILVIFGRNVAERVLSNGDLIYHVS